MKLVSTLLEKTVTLSFISERYIVVGGYAKLVLWSRGTRVWFAIFYTILFAALELHFNFSFIGLNILVFKIISAEPERS